MTGWLDQLVERIAEDGAVVRITVVEARGSTPRETGASMLVTPTGAHSTIGGGALEFAAVARAQNILTGPAMSEDHWFREVQNFPLGPGLGQCCGGLARLVFELFGPRELNALIALSAIEGMGDGLLLRPLNGGAPLRLATSRKQVGGWPLPVARVVRDMLSGRRQRSALWVKGRGGEPDWFVEPAARQPSRLYLYGAGHVGRAIVRALTDLPFDIVWIDTARDRFPEHIPDRLRTVITAAPAVFAGCAEPGAFHLVMTFSHALDLAICHTLLAADSFARLGLIGSQTKRVRFIKRLREAGVGDRALARMTCPIGIAGLAGKEPAIIAVSVAAELIQWRQELARSERPLDQSGEDRQ